MMEISRPRQVCALQDAFIDVCGDKDEAMRSGFHRPESLPPYVMR